MGAKITLIDEADFLNQKTIKDSIFPTLKLDKAKLIMISTPNTRGGLCKDFMNVENDDKTKLFKTAYITQVCEKCLGTPKETFCTHIYKPPHWHSADKNSKTVKLYMNDVASRNREIFGIIDAEDNSYAFSRNDINELAVKALFKFKKSQIPVKTIFVGIDTAGLGKSESAMFSFFYDGANPVICGLDSEHHGQNLDILENMLSGHINGLKKLSVYKQGVTRIITLPEAYSLNSCYIRQYLAKMHNDIFILMETSKGELHPGGFTTPMTKNEGVRIIKEHLLKHSISYNHEMVCTLYDKYEPLSKEDLQKDLDKKLYNNKKKFEEQLKMFKRVLKQSIDNSSESFSGKLNSDNKIVDGQCDDMVMSAVVGLYRAEQVINGKAMIDRMETISKPITYDQFSKFLK
jgi:hypothetical protein